jgi:hypothetical protein
MSTLDNSGGDLTDFGRLTASTVTTIFTASGSTWIHSITAAERTGATPNLTIEVYDVANTTSYYKRFAVAMTAGTEVVYSEPFLLPALWAIRMTSSDAAGKIDWTVTYSGPAAGKLR